MYKLYVRTALLYNQLNGERTLNILLIPHLIVRWIILVVGIANLPDGLSCQGI
jgi:hypothetical protein